MKGEKEERGREGGKESEETERGWRKGRKAIRRE